MYVFALCFGGDADEVTKADEKILREISGRFLANTKGSQETVIAR
jgi:hypothetical protein